MADAKPASVFSAGWPALEEELAGERSKLEAEMRLTRASRRTPAAADAVRNSRKVAEDDHDESWRLFRLVSSAPGHQASGRPARAGGAWKWSEPAEPRKATTSGRPAAWNFHSNSGARKESSGAAPEMVYSASATHRNLLTWCTFTYTYSLTFLVSVMATGRPVEAQL